MLKLRRVLAVAGVALLAVAGSTATSAAGTTTPTGVAAISPAGQTVGVAQPVTVTFDGPVADRVRAERSVAISAPTVPEGSFEWLSDRVLQWTPEEFWPAHSTITVSVGDTKASFQTGAVVLGVADIDEHTFTVSIDGEVVREMPASMGKPKFPTPIGRFRVLEKQDVVVMDSRTIGIPLDDPEGYKLTVYDAVRITWGGVYVHGAPWSTGSQGYANVSHGCINLSPENADWYFNQVRIGDPVIVQA
ncbi:ErfK/YbiS/YcfS/YnhG [Mycolicibacterium phlei]|uniref:L,D-transpeptidase n=1 Tax=Mycolicibacterium phlei TaxID=1771 RepID=UPI0002FCE6BF|nr:L,D-transpeptidase [Mycolicibacterium phlei]AMO61261.1 Putative L,D-transpeptidase LppS precursor [Mycolicibacterium phlei]STZ18218.1 ErfK/YbiS/YcfS/YnhG [Mycolicibacterium phlei]VEG09374.1 ErfK/YbiS/YcfS/YnhG [Mycobacteroides chelonae]